MYYQQAIHVVQSENKNIWAILTVSNWFINFSYIREILAKVIGSLNYFDKSIIAMDLKFSFSDIRNRFLAERKFFPAILPPPNKRQK